MCVCDLGKLTLKVKPINNEIMKMTRSLNGPSGYTVFIRNTLLKEFASVNLNLSSLFVLLYYL